MRMVAKTKKKPTNKYCMVAHYKVWRWAYHSGFNKDTDSINRFSLQKDEKYEMQIKQFTVNR
jgi:hypothetical protein